jgi:hypothetical protein
MSSAKDCAVGLFDILTATSAAASGWRGAAFAQR